MEESSEEQEPKEKELTVEELIAVLEKCAELFESIQTKKSCLSDRISQSDSG